jgi:hypothetical protein
MRVRFTLADRAVTACRIASRARCGSRTGRTSACGTEFPRSREALKLSAFAAAAAGFAPGGDARLANERVRPMPRYFFHIRDGFDLDEDDEGVELPDIEAARAEALATVEELRNELRDAGNIELEIADESGRRLLSVPFRNQRGGRRP